MRLRLPPGLRYPITVTELFKQESEDVEVNDHLFRYEFKTTKEEDDYLGETHTVEKTFTAVFESELEGQFSDWLISRGQVIRSPLDFAEIKEPCTHEVQFHGICALCGKDMTQLSYNKRNKDTVRAGINMMHDDSNLKISTQEASRSEEEAKKRLIRSERLSLVVDLDQTIIHATVDPTVGEWQHDPENPNHSAVADVKSFQLTDDGPGNRTCWYYIKTRPGLQRFLANVSKLYELHIYTMGTRAYAKEIAKIVDPDRSIFADRILSRDESGSLTAKNLQRLFPIDTKMVVIIDDRGDVWKWNDNLVKVTPYDFFVGIGDINSSFLPQKPKTQSTPKEHVPATTQLDVNGNGNSTDSDVNGLANGGPSSTLDQLVSMGGGDDPARLKDQAEKAAQAIDSQLEQRPLLQKQKALDEAEEEVMSQSASSPDSNSPEKQRHHLLEDHDNELWYLEQSLTQVHKNFYSTYRQRLELRQSNASVSTLSTFALDKAHAVDRAGHSDQAIPASATSLGENKAQLAAPSDPETPALLPDLAILPDIKTVMPDIKKRVLAGVDIVFSGVVPLGVDIQGSDIAIWATSFGANIRMDLSKKTTHVVAARKGTMKVKHALRYGRGRIKVVGTQWLMDSIIRWSRQEETPYLLHSEEDDILPADPRTGVEEDEADILSESEEPIGEDIGLTDGEVTDAERPTTQPKVKLRVKTGSPLKNNDGNGTAGDLEADGAGIEFNSPFDEHSPIGNDTDWKDMDDEFEEFMGEDYEGDSDDPSEKADDKQAEEHVTSALSDSSRKRPSDEEDETLSSTEGRTSKKIRNETSIATSEDGGKDEGDDGFEEDFEKAWEE